MRQESHDKLAVYFNSLLKHVTSRILFGASVTLARWMVSCMHAWIVETIWPPSPLGLQSMLCILDLSMSRTNALCNGDLSRLVFVKSLGIWTAM